MRLKYREDLLLFPRWFREVVYYHCKEDVWDWQPGIVIHLHPVINGVEFDVIMRCRKARKVNVVCFELKDADMDKVLSQAIVRRDQCDYIYVVADLDTYVMLNQVARSRHGKEALRLGVGLVSARDDVLVLKSYSRGFYERYGGRRVNLLELMGGGSGEG